MRLIDADKILEKMQSVFDMQNLYLPVHFQLLVVDDMPTVDAVPVVRCKDCKECGSFLNQLFCSRNGDGVREDEFCSFGSEGVREDEFCTFRSKRDETD